MQVGKAMDAVETIARRSGDSAGGDSGGARR